MELHEFAAELYPHARLLRRLARRWAGVDADDLVQETFARALAARHRYQVGSNGRAWLLPHPVQPRRSPSAAAARATSGCARA